MLRALAFLGLVLLLLNCKDAKLKTDYTKPKKNDNFIQLVDNQFFYKGKPFFPMMLNYVTYIRNVNGKYVVSPDKEYDDPTIYEGSDADSVLHVLKGHLTLIKELGFNTVRWVYRTGLNRFQNKLNIKIYGNQGFKEIPLAGNEQIIFDCADQFLNIADTIGLKVMYLIEPPIDHPELEQFTIQLLKKFQDRSVIFAYDFFNEPLYFDNENLPPSQRNRSKQDALRLVSKWRDWVREYAPYHLFTIGFAEPIEVFEWDPSILPVDFVEFHTYHPLRFPNEVFWYTQYVKKPVMIGETSLPADNDSITYEEQRQFMVDAYHYARSLGCIGFGWWQFQEVQWGNYEHDFTALLNHKGITKTKSGNFIIKGSLKPAALEVKKLLETIPPKIKKPQPWVNYYNMLGYQNIVLKGKIVEAGTQKPIEGALIRGWTEWWDIAANTYTNAKGEFTLYSNKEFVHFQVSAPGKENLTFDYKAQYKPIVPNPTPWDQLPYQQLEYHKISYQPFLKKDTTGATYKTFHFEPSLFYRAQYEGEMKTIELKKVNF
jgi:hypothetical protein